MGTALEVVEDELCAVKEIAVPSLLQNRRILRNSALKRGSARKQSQVGL